MSFDFFYEGGYGPASIILLTHPPPSNTFFYSPNYPFFAKNNAVFAFALLG